jgi:hypothetical protein
MGRHNDQIGPGRCHLMRKSSDNTRTTLEVYKANSQAWLTHEPVVNRLEVGAFVPANRHLEMLVCKINTFNRG